MKTLLPSKQASPSKATPARTVTSTKQTTLSSNGPSTTKSTKTAPNKLVRTDQHAQTLDGMFLPVVQIVDDEGEGDTSRPSKRRKSDHDPDFASQLAEESMNLLNSSRTKIAMSECLLKSVKDLRKSVIEKCHEGEFIFQLFFRRSKEGY